jgi:hypothetical protein
VVFLSFFGQMLRQCLKMGKSNLLSYQYLITVSPFHESLNTYVCLGIKQSWLRILFLILIASFHESPSSRPWMSPFLCGLTVLLLPVGEFATQGCSTLFSMDRAILVLTGNISGASSLDFWHGRALLLCRISFPSTYIWDISDIYFISVVPHSLSVA